jgi:phospholipid transport system substrate-binding protein
MTLRRLATAFVLLLLIAPLAPRPSPAAAADAAAFVNDFASKVLELVRNPPAEPGGLERRLRPLALDAFDVPRIGRFALRRYWADMSDAERQQFTEAFSDYIVHVYAARFTRYGGERFAVTGSRPEGSTAVLVRSEVTQPQGGPPIKLDWQVERVAERYKVVDVTIDGVSQALTYREEFTAVVERHGGRVADLTAELRERAKS